MRWLAGVMVWITIILFVGVFAFCKSILVSVLKVSSVRCLLINPKNSVVGTR